LVGQLFNEVYCGSKFAVVGYIESLASYVGPAFGLDFRTVNRAALSRSVVNTDLTQFGATSGVLEDEYLPILQKYLDGRAARAAGITQTSEDVAAVVMSCLATKKSPIRMSTSPWSEEFTRLKTASGPDGGLIQARVINEMLGGLD
jgi:NAD(P)-dependent dehydrogenase (short-subunit alcohol dehydrogenase family)